MSLSSSLQLKSTLSAFVVCAGNIKFPSSCQARCAGFIIFHATKPDRSCSTRRMLQQLDPLSPSDVLISANNTASNGSNSTNSNSKEYQPRGARLDQRFPTLPGIPDLCTCSGMYKPVCGGDDSRLKFSNICSGRCAGYKRFKRAGPDGLCPPKKPTTP